MAKNTQPNESIYADLMNDVGFKIVFGTEGNEDLMAGLLQAILPQLNIETVLYVQNQAPLFAIDSKRSIYDVHCKLQDGSHVVVEVQNYTQDYFEDRILYYEAALISSQIETGKDESYELDPVYVVTITSFTRKHDDNWTGGICSSYVFREETTGEYLEGKKTRLTFVELGRFNKSAHECKTFEEKCYYCLKNMLRIKERPEGFDGEYFDKLFYKANHATFTSDQKLIYHQAMTTERDIHNQIRYAVREAQEKGLQAGMEQGLAEGIKKMATFMKSHGFPVEEIIKQTGLSAEAIAAL